MKHLTDTLIGDSPGFRYPQTERPIGHLALANNISCSWGTQTPPMACQSRPSTTGARFLFWGAVLTLWTSQHVGIEQHVRFGAMNLMKVRIPAGTTCWEALYFCSTWSCGSEFWICKIERWCCEAWIKSNLSLFNWCDCRIRSGRNTLWRQSNSLVDVLFCLVVMDLLIPGRRGAEGAWWKARLRVWWVGRQFLL